MTERVSEIKCFPKSLLATITVCKERKFRADTKCKDGKFLCSWFISWAGSFILSRESFSLGALSSIWCVGYKNKSQNTRHDTCGYSYTYQDTETSYTHLQKNIQTSVAAKFSLAVNSMRFLKSEFNVTMLK